MKGFAESWIRLFLMLNLFLVWVLLLEIILLGGIPYLVGR